MKRAIKHILIVATVLAVTVVLPFSLNRSIFFGSNTDAIAQATAVIPDEPSGDYVVLINKKLHGDSLDDWISFFNDEDFAVIFDDIKCTAAKGDTNGIQLAERFMAQLPENQMQLSTEDPTLLISKAEKGYIDTAVFSKEMADALKLLISSDDIAVVYIHGGTKDAEET